MTEPTSRAATDTRARNRFIVMNVARFAGLGMVMFGMAIIQRVVDLPVSFGVVLAVIGMIDFFVVPIMLARAWSREEAVAKGKAKP